MLESNAIPSIEPIINVGIVLPEDNCKKLLIKIPAEPAYRLNHTHGALNLKPGIVLQIEFKIQKCEVTIDQDNRFLDKQVRIECISDDRKLAPGQGLIVHDVIAGREFHWKKQITVKLPGDVQIDLHKESLALINILPLEQYVMCVATSEMGATCPDALIESQTIAARSWILANVEQKHRHLNMDVCNDDCCQRYQGSTYLTEQSVRGALNTFGKVLMHEEQICDARYSKSCGGMMERFESIWPGESHAYLQSIPDTIDLAPGFEEPLDNEESAEKWIRSVPDTFCSSKNVKESNLSQYLGSVDEEAHYFRWKFEHTQESLTAALNQANNLNIDQIRDLIPISRGGSGRIIKLKIIYKDQDGTQKEYFLPTEFEIRRSLDKGFLFSSAFIVEKYPVDALYPQKITLLGAGWGHGVGYCQIGALGMAMNNFSTEQILKHYYPESRLVKLY